MRILWHSTNPLAHSGYGNMTRELILRLRAEGHFVRVATKHADHAWNDWNGFEVCEGTNTAYINQMIKEEKFDYIITLWDIWLMNGKQQYIKDKWIAYVPVDTEWISDAMEKVLKSTASQIAMSKHGERELKRVGYKPMYAPSGIDTNQFKPISGGRKAFHDDLGLDKDNFIIGTVGLNYADDRKGFIPLMIAFKEFRKTHPEARLFIYSWANDQSSVANRINYNRVVESLGIQEMVGWPHQSDIFLGRITADMLCEFYNGFDVFCLPTKGEGFGLPLIEAPACFPAGTNVYAENIYKKINRIYSGNLISIKTNRGTIKVTPDHPFWTNNGWILAKHLDKKSRLLYNSKYDNVILRENDNAKERILQLFKGRIEDAPEIISEDDIDRSSKKNEQKLQFSSLAKISTWFKKAIFSNSSETQGQAHKFRMGLSCRPDRWRRKYSYKKIWKKIKAIYQNYRHIASFDELASREDRFAWNMAGNRTIQGYQKRGIYFPHDRISTFINLSKISSIINNQEKTYGVNSRILFRKTCSKQITKTNRTPKKDCIDDSESQYESIISIKHRLVSNLPVYNFTTKSGTYFVGGYLVHNCGIPVITTATTTGVEFQKAGLVSWLIDIDKLDDSRWLSTGGWRYEPRPSEIIKCLEAAYNCWKYSDYQKMKTEVRQKALKYDWDNVFNKFWQPILKILEDKLKEGSNDRD